MAAAAAREAGVCLAAAPLAVGGATRLGDTNGGVPSDEVGVDTGVLRGTFRGTFAYGERGVVDVPPSKRACFGGTGSPPLGGVAGGGAAGDGTGSVAAWLELLSEEALRKCVTGSVTRGRFTPSAGDAGFASANTSARIGFGAGIGAAAVSPDAAG